MKLSPNVVSLDLGHIAIERHGDGVGLKIVTGMGSSAYVKLSPAEIDELIDALCWVAGGDNQPLVDDHAYVPIDTTAHGDSKPTEAGVCGHRDRHANPDCGLPREGHRE